MTDHRITAIELPALIIRIFKEHELIGRYSFSVNLTRAPFRYRPCRCASEALFKQIGLEHIQILPQPGTLSFMRIGFTPESTSLPF